MTDGLCVEGLRRAARSLRMAFSKGQDKPAREDMAVASFVRRTGSGERRAGRGAWFRRTDWRQFFHAARRDLRGIAAARDGDESSGAAPA